MNKLDKNIKEIKVIQEDLELRTVTEKQAETLIIEGEYQSAIKLLETLCSEK